MKTLKNRKTLKNTFLFLLLTSFGLWTCGKEDSTDDLTAIQDTNAQLSMTSAEEGFDTVNDDSSINTSLGLNEEGLSATETEFERSRTCVLNSDGTVTVSITTSGSVEKTVNRFGRGAVISFQAANTEKRVASAV